MPLPLLIALFLAFGFDPSAGRPVVAPLSRAEALSRTGEAAVGLLVVAAFAFLLGRVVASRVARLGRPSALVRRAYTLGVRGVDLLSLAIYGALIRELEWPRGRPVGVRPGRPHPARRRPDLAPVPGRAGRRVVGPV